MPRFAVQAPVDVTVLRSGVSDTVPGRSLNLCERGLAAVMAGELTPGESVGVELRFNGGNAPLRAQALVKYHDKLRCGLEFLGLTLEQRAAVRDWAKIAKADAEQSVRSTVATSPAEGKISSPGRKISTTDSKVAHGDGSGGGPDEPKRRFRRPMWIMVVLLLALLAGIWWWRWDRAWDELESGLKPPRTSATEKAQAQVPAEVMEKLLTHRVEPTYPVEARGQNIQGVIALDVVVGRDGSVVSMHPLNGPEVLAHAAMDALRWWRFEPYRLNGEPAIVETTLAVEFKR